MPEIDKPAYKVGAHWCAMIDENSVDICHTKAELCAALGIEEKYLLSRATDKGHDTNCLCSVEITGTVKRLKHFKYESYVTLKDGPNKGECTYRIVSVKDKCDKIVVDDRELTKQTELASVLGRSDSILMREGKRYRPNECLCDVDVLMTAIANGFEQKTLASGEIKWKPKPSRKR